MTYSSRRKEVDMKKVIMIIAVAAILVGCKGKGTRVQISDSVDKFKASGIFGEAHKGTLKGGLILLKLIPILIGLPQRRQANLVGTISYLKKFPAYQQ